MFDFLFKDKDEVTVMAWNKNNPWLVCKRDFKDATKGGKFQINKIIIKKIDGKEVWYFSILYYPWSYLKKKWIISGDERPITFKTIRDHEFNCVFDYFENANRIMRNVKLRKLKGL